MAKRTPPIMTKGRYQLKMPWQADPTKIYVCHAVRSFEDIAELGVNVFEAYYEPNGLDFEDYDNDVNEKANIVTLMSDDDTPIYVPDTYILSYPDMGVVQYDHIVLSMSMGALPEYVSLDYLKQQISNLALDVIGVTPEVKEHRAATNDAITPQQHEILEAARLASIQMQTTDYARLKELQVQYDAALQKIATLEQIIIDNGLLG